LESEVNDRVSLALETTMHNPFGGEMFELTTVGRLYLSGDLDAVSLPRQSELNA
jgi:hypothetical protein